MGEFLIMGKFPGLEKHFKDGNIVFFNDTPQLDDNLIWRRQRMTVREFAILGLEEQIVVTKELNGEWLAREKSVFTRDAWEAAMAFADSCRITEKGKNGAPDVQGMSKEETNENILKTLKERTAANMAYSPV